MNALTLHFSTLGNKVHPHTSVYISRVPDSNSNKTGLSPFKHSVMSEHPVCHFALLAPCQGKGGRGRLSCREAGEERENEERGKRQGSPACACSSPVEEKRRQCWRPNLWAWLSSHYNQTGATRRRGECVITFNLPWLTRDNKLGQKCVLTSNRSVYLVIRSADFRAVLGGTGWVCKHLTNGCGLWKAPPLPQKIICIRF